ncbi:sulfate transporter [Rhodanobacter thiooxydans]|uniref:Sulfate transporter n=1 Tax=Rhodanobacter thiooxydans TaxID=416169 RepID=A0A154QDS5_9GAMM|nr:STAS domain-containing protein [Rhodanobacter thiooxydans]EIM01021.1 putative NTP binding protein (contains STAS domain) [Rhodanobacter thiooxydans LCS2]KZC22358.1 sulfate transporter [Rhodanobacter thiooxydans]
MTQAAADSFQLDTGTPGTLGVCGELSFDTAAAAWQAIRVALTGRPISRLDLAGVRHSDSAGLACVLAVAADATRRGQALQVVHVPAGMQSLAQVCEVDRLFG